eukprot:TRINITY_DN12999_c0_g1_i1.p1 TRINITY_DN12999_c0_g1~~TRINITY_DN12999_c0_g1_i1.p1  ORF type:complete len:126 (-),score=16.25 TRINITY_DN12999_c0_g1_i1:24-353(-)
MDELLEVRATVRTLESRVSSIEDGLQATSNQLLFVCKEMGSLQSMCATIFGLLKQQAKQHAPCDTSHDIHMDDELPTMSTPTLPEAWTRPIVQPIECAPRDDEWRLKKE